MSKKTPRAGIFAIFNLVAAIFYMTTMWHIYAYLLMDRLGQEDSLTDNLRVFSGIRLGSIYPKSLKKQCEDQIITPEIEREITENHGIVRGFLDYVGEELSDQYDRCVGLLSGAFYEKFGGYDQY